MPAQSAILKLGPDDPASLAWLWQHWGTCWPLRRVERLARSAEAPAGERAGEGEAAFWMRFWSADWMPWRALAAVRAQWPELHIHVRAVYALY